MLGSKLLIVFLSLVDVYTNCYGLWGYSDLRTIIWFSVGRSIYFGYILCLFELLAPIVYRFISFWRRFLKIKNKVFGFNSVAYIVRKKVLLTC